MRPQRPRRRVPPATHKSVVSFEESQTADVSMGDSANSIINGMNPEQAIVMFVEFAQSYARKADQQREMRDNELSEQIAQLRKDMNDHFEHVKLELKLHEITEERRREAEKKLRDQELKADRTDRNKRRRELDHRTTVIFVWLVVVTVVIAILIWVSQEGVQQAGIWASATTLLALYSFFSWTGRSL